KFSTADQLLSRISRGHSLDTFHVGMRLNTGESFRTRFRKEYKTAFRIEGMDISWGLGELAFWPEMTEGEIVKTGITKGMDFAEEVPQGFEQGKWVIARDRCFIGPVWVAKGPNGTSLSHGARPGAIWEEIIPRIIHLPGLRGNP